MPDQSYGPVKSYSYRFDTADRSIVFTGDTGPSAAVIELAKGADILVSEVIDLPGVLRYIGSNERLPPAALKPLTDHMIQEHLLPQEVGKLATAAGVKMVVLSHFSLGTDDEHDMTPYTAGVKTYFKGPVVAGHDLAEF